MMTTEPDNVKEIEPRLEPRLFSIQKAVQYTGWPYTTLRRAALAGKLKCVRIPGSKRLWFEKRELDRVIRAWGT